MKTKRYWLAAIALATLAVTAVPAQAHTDVSVGLSLGTPYYYAPPRHYEPAVVYEEPTYYEPEVVYYHERRYCPPHRVHYYGRPGYAYGHYRRHYRDWDDD